MKKKLQTFKKIVKLKSEIDKEIRRNPENSLLELLKKFIINIKPTQENYQNAENFIKNIISQPRSIFIDKKEIELIHVPNFIKDFKEFDVTEEQKFFNILIEYSKNYKLIENICKNKQRYSSLIILEKNHEIKEIVELISKNCILNKILNLNKMY